MRQYQRPGDVAPGYQRVYLEPHFDDVALSCGGSLARYTSGGERCLVFTLFAGNPGPGAEVTEFAAGQHIRWGGADDPIEARRAEQVAALTLLGADWLPGPWLDAIYRGEQYLSDSDLFGVVKPGDVRLEAALRAAIDEIAKTSPKAVWYVPLCSGNHVDHQIARAAARSMSGVRAYEDFPYAARDPDLDERGRAVATGEREVVEIEPWLDLKIEAIGQYVSQIPTLFGTRGLMVEAVVAFVKARGNGRAGECFWPL